MSKPLTIDEGLRQSQHEAIAATKAMFATESDAGYPSLNTLIENAADGDPANEPITDWDAFDPLFVSSKDIADYEADHGTGSVPAKLKAAVLARENEDE